MPKINDPDLPSKDPELRYEYVPGAIDLEEFLGWVLHKQSDIWYEDWKLYFGGIVIVISIVLAFAEEWNKKLFPRGSNKAVMFKCLEILAIDILFLHFMQYVHHWLFCCYAFSLVYIFFFTIRALAHPRTPKNYHAQNVYLCFHTPFSKVVLIFLGQALLTKFLMNATFHVHYVNTSYLYWLSAFLGVQVSCMFGRGDDSQVGAPFRCGLWAYLMSNSSQICFREDVTSARYSPSSFDIWTRGLMSFLINGVLRDAVAYCIPVLLMASANDMEFVQNALAIAFIPTISNSGEHKTFHIESKGSMDVESKGAFGLMAAGSSTASLASQSDMPDASREPLTVYRDSHRVSVG